MYKFNFKDCFKEKITKKKVENRILAQLLLGVILVNGSKIL